VQIGSEGASTQVGETQHIYDFFDCFVLSFSSRASAQVELINRLSRFMAQTTRFRARKAFIGG